MPTSPSADQMKTKETASEGFCNLFRQQIIIYRIIIPTSLSRPLLRNQKREDFSAEYSSSASALYL